MTHPSTVADTLDAGHTPGKWRAEAWSAKEAQVVAMHGGKRSLICAGVLNSDATLIAASKDMLAALTALIPADFDEHPQDFTDDWHQARTAIAKARGEVQP